MFMQSVMHAYSITSFYCAVSSQVDERMHQIFINWHYTPLALIAIFKKQGARGFSLCIREESNTRRHSLILA
jgi:hypothetical protein